jgi:hypothetical protein
MYFDDFLSRRIAASIASLSAYNCSMVILISSPALSSHSA